MQSFAVKHRETQAVKHNRETPSKNTKIPFFWKWDTAVFSDNLLYFFYLSI